MSDGDRRLALLGESRRREAGGSKAQRIRNLHWPAPDMHEDQIDAIRMHVNCRCWTPADEEARRFRAARNVTPVQRKLPAS